MQVFVSDLEHARTVAIDNGVTHIVSLLDPGHDVDHGLNAEHFVMQFEDAMDAETSGAPTVKQVQIVLDWVRANTNSQSRLLVHCHGGVSRSTAMAVAILIQSGSSVENAIAEIRRQRPVFCPNNLISEFADRILGMDGQLHAACEREANRHILSILSE